jgi:enediyne biosynthesis protein E4
MNLHSRRSFLGLMAAPLIRGQGMATRTVAPAPRSKPSDKSFLARFTDIGKQAGLRHSTIYGPMDHKDYIIETMGCGCAFLDYDNDGWMDILVLSGSRVAGAPEGTSSRLYKNNRDGTFTDVTAKAGLMRNCWASGGYDRRLQ